MLPIFLLVAGAGIGGVVGGTKSGLVGGAIGFAVGCILMVAAMWAFDRARDNMPD